MRCTGPWLSWESAAFATRRSRVRSSSGPPKKAVPVSLPERLFIRFYIRITKITTKICKLVTLFTTKICNYITLFTANNATVIQIFSDRGCLYSSHCISVSGRYRPLFREARCDGRNPTNPPEEARLSAAFLFSEDLLQTPVLCGLKYVSYECRLLRQVCDIRLRQ